MADWIGGLKVWVVLKKGRHLQIARADLARMQGKQGCNGWTLPPQKINNNNNNSSKTNKQKTAPCVWFLFLWPRFLALRWIVAQLPRCGVVQASNSISAQRLA